MSEAFLTVFNTHAESCGILPSFKSCEGYLSYFEGGQGDQWGFAMDRASRVFFVCGGDIGWESRRIGEER